MGRCLYSNLQFWCLFHVSDSSNFSSVMILHNFLLFDHLHTHIYRIVGKTIISILYAGHPTKVGHPVYNWVSGEVCWWVGDGRFSSGRWVNSLKGLLFELILGKNEQAITTYRLWSMMKATWTCPICPNRPWFLFYKARVPLWKPLC